MSILSVATTCRRTARAALPLLAALAVATCGCASRQRYAEGELPRPRPRKVRVAEVVDRPPDPRVFAEYEERLLARVPWPGASAAEVDATLRARFSEAALKVAGVVDCQVRAVDGALIARIELAPRADPARTGARIAAGLESFRAGLPEGVGKAEIIPLRERRPGLAMAE
jgi:hypothetical protein